MKNAFILKGNIYSFKRLNVGIYIETCYELDVTLEELHKRVADKDLESMLMLMYYSLRDSKGMTIDEFKELTLEEFELISDMFKAVNK